MLPSERHEREKENQKGRKQKKTKTPKTTEARGPKTKNLVVLFRDLHYSKNLPVPLFSLTLPATVELSPVVIIGYSVPT